MAITERLTALRMTQQQLALTSGISPATIRELQHGRRRATRGRTLSALSAALGWPTGYLTGVLRGEPTSAEPTSAEPTPGERDPVLVELAAIRTELRELREQLAHASGISDVDGRLAEITARLSTLEARKAGTQRINRP